MAAVTDAPPTLDELTWEEAVSLGSQAWESAEQSKWDLGDIGAIVAHKWQTDSVKKFAASIGMHDNMKRLYDYMQVAQHYPKSARAQFPDVTWSAFRECGRHGLTLEQSLAALAEHGDKPVAKIRRILTGDEPRTVTATFDVHALLGWSSDGPRAVMDMATMDKLSALLDAHPGATIAVTVTYTDDARR